MGNEFQNVLDQERLTEARKNLNEFTGKINKKRFMKEIENIDNEYIDEVQLNFIGDNDLNFDEIRLIKKFCDHMKNN